MQVSILREPLVLALVVFVGIVALGYVFGQFTKRVLTAIGVGTAVEGTAFERTAQGLGSSTVSVVSRLSSWFIYGVGLLFALYVAGVLDVSVLFAELTWLLPRAFIALFVIIVGIIAGDKVEVLFNERLRGVKFPEVGLIGTVAKYSVIYVAVLIALGQLGIATNALLVLLAVYVFGLVFLGGIAGRDLLASGVAGLYLFLNEPYGIGDRVQIGDRAGVVQEIELFVTRIEDDGTEYIVPNRTVFEEGASKRLP
ncbi:putative mechanosensitive channel protein [Halalkalicoccus paucihalophilus]|jgi:small-conductance mechanosensitive channel|uniref:Putative mechanosensitive channel protein n=1 Tax=Halalkalicoccus paucihalophilus TaxID=1008153 RepID=A0A151AI21_9EURY|nr:mechanosensitive ion channel domain-containing protein [Halalkalicoccus paucihalophilus]KYH27232.1 putative mechanosensitive channel protein [Halalkalicoccus paucihalophilus]